MSDPQLDDLLVEWELARQEGRELSAAELCVDAPELQAELELLIDEMKASSWMLGEASDGPVSHRAPDAPASRRLPMVDEFLEELAAADILSDEEAQRLNETRASYASSVDVADGLVERGKLTRYQADVLLRRREGPIRLDRYLVLDTIGSGGMGLVFKALHRAMDRVVALKVMAPLSVGSGDQLDRFRREIRAVAKISHPNVVAAYDAHEENGVHFLVMEYVEGKDLRQLVSQHGPLEVGQAATVAIQVADALQASHVAQIVHRDVKPGNIVLAKDGLAKLLDLGLARLRAPEVSQQKTAREQKLTGEGLAMGTVDFMSPEQALDSSKADGRSDIYSLGCTLFYLITGRPPFEETTAVQTILAHREKHAPAIRDLRPEVPDALAAVVDGMLAKVPEDRFATMSEVKQALESTEVAKPLTTSRLQTPAGSLAQTAPMTPQVPVGRAGADAAPSSGARGVVSDAGRPRLWPMALIASIGVAMFCLMLAWKHGYLPGSEPASQPVSANLHRDVAKWAITSGGSVVIETELGEQEVVAVEELPDDAFQVLEIYLYDLTDRISVTPLAKLPSLTLLSIEGADQSTVSFQDLGLLDQLKSLDLTDCAVTSDEVAQWENLTQLEALMLDGTLVRDDALATIGKLSKLRTLSLVETPVTGVGLKRLARLSQLTELDLAATELGPGALENLRELKQLRSIDLSSTSINDEDVTLLGEFESLRFLSLDYCANVTAIGLRELGRCKKLRTLYVEETPLDDALLAEWSSLELDYLDVAGTQITPQGLAALESMVSLRDLRLAALVDSEVWIEALTKLQQLEGLNIDGASIDDAMLARLAALKGLKQISLVECEEVTDDGLIDFSEALPTCDVIAGDGLETLSIDTF